MATRAEKLQAFIRYYKRVTGAAEVNMKEVAAMAQKMDWKMPVPPDPLEILAKQFSQAAGEETRTDKETNRVYKANLAITERRHGKQLTFWIDVDDNPPRHRMVKGLNNYREQMVGEAIIGKNTAEYWNKKNPDQPPLPFDTDLTDDVNWRLNAPEEPKKVRRTRTA
jgi:hypothetical protein